ncbi:hypothetical protein OH492_13070 [Vibrio chagasii]|nr:hypothetical protein [Vibrio chagasii]
MKKELDGFCITMISPPLLQRQRDSSERQHDRQPWIHRNDLETILNTHTPSY